MNKTITLPEETWERLTEQKLKYKLPTINAVIIRLLNSEWSVEDEQ